MGLFIGRSDNKSHIFTNKPNELKPLYISKNDVDIIVILKSERKNENIIQNDFKPSQEKR